MGDRCFQDFRVISHKVRAALLTLHCRGRYGMLFAPSMRQALIEGGLAVPTGRKHRTVMLTARGRWHARRFVEADVDLLVRDAQGESP
jgi:hypothetical protein